MRATRPAKAMCSVLILATAGIASAWENIWAIDQPDAENYLRRVGFLVVVPTVPSTIYIATTEWLFRSTDGGMSWATASTGKATSAKCLSGCRLRQFACHTYTST